MPAYLLNKMRQFGLSPREVMIALVIAIMLVLAVVPAFAQSETLSLNIDPSPLFSSIESYVPLFFGILAVAGGILIGKRIAEFIIKSIADAF